VRKRKVKTAVGRGRHEESELCLGKRGERVGWGRPGRVGWGKIGGKRREQTV